MSGVRGVRACENGEQRPSLLMARSQPQPHGVPFIVGREKLLATRGSIILRPFVSFVSQTNARVPFQSPNAKINALLDLNNRCFGKSDVVASENK